MRRRLLCHRPAPVHGASQAMRSTSPSRWSTSPRWRRPTDSPATSSTASRPRRSTSSSSRSTTAAGSTAARSMPIIVTSTPPTRPGCGPCARLDRGQSRRLRRPRRGGDVDGRQPALHHPGGPHALHQPVDDGDQLDPGRVALPVVDRTRRRRHPAGQWSTGGRSRGTIGGDVKVGVIAGDRASDQTALNQYLLPDLTRAGVTPVVKTHRRRALGHRRHRQRGPAGGPAAAVRRRHLGDPAHPLQRLLPGAPGRDAAAVLPQAPAVGLRVLDRIGPRADPGALRARPSTARRA